MTFLGSIFLSIMNGESRQGVTRIVPSLGVEEDHALLLGPVEDPDNLAHGPGECGCVGPHYCHPKLWLLARVHF